MNPTPIPLCGRYVTSAGDGKGAGAPRYRGSSQVQGHSCTLPNHSPVKGVTVLGNRKSAERHPCVWWHFNALSLLPVRCHHRGLWCHSPLRSGSAETRSKLKRRTRKWPINTTGWLAYLWVRNLQSSNCSYMARVAWFRHWFNKRWQTCWGSTSQYSSKFIMLVRRDSSSINFQD